jgi:hypothetical protein
MTNYGKFLILLMWWYVEFVARASPWFRHRRGVHKQNRSSTFNIQLCSTFNFDPPLSAATTTLSLLTAGVQDASGKFYSVFEYSTNLIIVDRLSVWKGLQPCSGQFRLFNHHQRVAMTCWWVYEGNGLDGEFFFLVFIHVY